MVDGKCGEKKALKEDTKALGEHYTALFSVTAPSKYHR